MNPVLQGIADKHQLPLTAHRPLSGGDINEVHLLACSPDEYVIKLNDAGRFPGMFEAEARGLQLLKASGSFRVPAVRAAGIYEQHAYLLLEYLPSGTPGPGFWPAFAKQLARLHRCTAAHFGLDHDNYIGSLPQENGYMETATNFYIGRRLQPQFEMAHNNGFKFDALDAFFKNISGIIPGEPPSLIHGDLWSGNYMCSEEGLPVLIDPAVAYAPREMDLAMMQLFGGFPSEVFEQYNQQFPLPLGWKARMGVWQLYYVLVHLNLFGSGYFSQAQRLIKSFS